MKILKNQKIWLMPARSTRRPSGPDRVGLSIAVCAAALATACGANQQTCTPNATYAPDISPSRFVAQVNNPLWPLVAGTRYVFGGAEDVEVTVTSESKTILGISATVVRDTVTTAGEVTEDTYDWYAQDADGNVWYLGEDTKEFEGGRVVSTEGTWESGVGGAQPGIVMHARQPALGVPYQQEYYGCQAEDRAEVVSLNETVSVPYGNFSGCLKTREFTPLEPDVNEYKYYCAGVGLVLEEDVASGARVELVSVMGP